VLVFVLIPVVAVVAAAIAAAVSVSKSSLRISAEGVEIRNYPQPPRLIPLADVERFEETPSVGNLSSLRPATAVLVCTNGARVPVRRIVEPEAGRGVDALNARLASLKQGPLVTTRHRTSLSHHWSLRSRSASHDLRESTGGAFGRTEWPRTIDVPSTSA
jgi:hypothetical protein